MIDPTEHVIKTNKHDDWQVNGGTFIGSSPISLIQLINEIKGFNRWN